MLMFRHMGVLANRGFSSIFALVIIGLAVAAGFAYWHAKSEVSANLTPTRNTVESPAPNGQKPEVSKTSPANVTFLGGLKTYSDPIHGFSFKYPADWSTFTDLALYTPEGYVSEYSLRSPDKLHIIRFFVFKIADLTESEDGCSFITYNVAEGNWRIEVENTTHFCTGEKPSVTYRSANSLVGNNISAYGILQEDPSHYLIPLRNGYGLEVDIINRSSLMDPTARDLVDPLAKPILSSFRIY